MKVPLSLLKKYLNFTCTVSELAEVLTRAGIEVDEIKEIGSGFSGVVVAQVLEVAKHPSADRLCVAQVTDGKEQFQVVCGASNCRAGLKTALAKIGAKLRDEKGKVDTIKKGKLRDVESFGMLCAADELGLGTGEGIMELASDLELGKDLAEIYSDTILEVSLTPNLGHCMSLWGIARELSAHLGIPLQPFSAIPSEEGAPIDKAIRVDLIDKRQCQRYGCRLVTGIEVGPSPGWLQEHLAACGLRSVNNVVDVGNWVMLALGQPLHLFDYDQIEGKRLVVTSVTSYSEMQTLDEVVRPIPREALLICDAVKPLAFAGVMGGKSSAVSEKTTNVLIEAAHFLPRSIRKTSKLLQLKTDSSLRFEKGVDPQLVPIALDYAAELLEKVAKGTSAEGRLDHKIHEFEGKKLECRTKKVNEILGTTLSTSEIAECLRKLGIEIVKEEIHQILVIVPSFRSDITGEIDLVEEVARVYGYNNLPKATPRYHPSTLCNASLYEMEKRCRECLLAEGLQELMTCDLISPAQSEVCVEQGMDRSTLISVLQPQSLDQSILRTTLLPGFLQLVKYNSDQGNKNVCGFEVGRIHFKQQDQYIEPSVAGIVFTGKRTPHHWERKPCDTDFFDLKGIVENLCSSFKLIGLTFEVSHLHSFHPGRQAKIKHKETIIGSLGEVHPKYLVRLGIDQRVFFAEINLNEMIPLLPKHWQVKMWSPFPGSQRDWTVTLAESMPVEKLFQAIRSIPSSLLEKVELLDLYKSEQIGQDKKNATLRFSYRDQEKTLSLEAVEQEHARVIAATLNKGPVL